MNLNPSAITKLFSDSPLLASAKTEFEDVLFYDIAKTIFGIIPESIEENLKLSTFHAICERFIGITINDIAIAFKTHVQEDKVYVLTRDEFIKPITKYWQKKQIVIRELNKELELQDEQLQVERKKHEFKQQSMQLYLDCLNSEKREWTGTPFQAATFAENFSELFTREEKDSIYAECKIEAYRIKQESNPFEQQAPISANHLFFQEIVKRALSKGQFLVMD